MSTSPNQIETIVDATLDLPPAARAAYLDKVCGDDASLRQTVEALLRAHEHAPAPGSPRPSPAISALAVNLPLSEQPGDHIGSYKLLQRIGEGGCGVVYMAEQEEPVRRRVALKVIKLGMDTKQVIARFEAERQALALMDHPNIAKILEAGATAAGRPYFVMELVRGIKLTDYCDQNNLPTQQRLDLFIQVCKAVQHAHQKGIIHRDLKPSNILVTLHDGVPVPKVIDFGIAKATAQRLTDKTVFTAFEQFIGTPAYMSPEQAEMSGLDIDTRSDIYSLGVLLYELLTSRIPFEAKDLAAAGLDEMRRIIREQDPVRPSTKLSNLQAADQTTVARQRQLEVAKLIHLVRGDLDWIVMKCLEKDRTRRYETANGLAVDIERHLSNEPVIARPPSSLYRLRKLVRRNRLGVMAVATVAVALLAAAGISSWMFFKENQARQRAEAAEQKSSVDATKSRQIAELLKAMLKSVGPSVARGRDTALMREILDATDQRLGRELTAQPEVEAELRLVMAKTYEDLGLFEQMKAMARKARSLAQAQPAGDPQLMATASIALAGAMFHEGNMEEAEALNLEALAAYRRFEGREGPGLAATLGNLALVLLNLGRFDQAEERCQESLAMNIKLHGEISEETFNSLNYLTHVLTGKQEMKAAENAARRALEVGQQVWDGEHPSVVKSRNDLAAILIMQGRDADAEVILRDLLPVYHKLYGEDHHDIAAALQNLGTCSRNQGKLDAAEKFQYDALIMRQKISVPPDHPAVASAMEGLGVTLSMRGKHSDALHYLTNALAINQKYFGGTNLVVATSLQNLGRTYRKCGLLDEAETAHQEAWRIRKQLLGDADPHPAVADSLGDLALVFQAKGRLGEAEKLCRASLDMQEKLYDKEDKRIAVTLKNLVSILLQQEKGIDEAVTNCKRCLAILEKKLPDAWQTFHARTLLGNCLLKQQHYREAEPLLVSGYEGLRQRLAMNPDAEPPLKASMQSLVALFEATNQPEQAAEWKSKLTDFDKLRHNE